MVIIEGNIGAGKSTFLTLLAKSDSSLVVSLEPLLNWQKEVHGQSLLGHFYTHPQRWAYTLETFALTCRVKEHLKDQAHANPLLLVERSIFSGHYVFAQNSHQQGFLSLLEWQLYLHMFTLLTRSCKPPLAFIYLHTTPEVAFERLKKRNRSGESSISLDYITQIHEKHEAFLKQAPLGLPFPSENGALASHFPPIPVLTLDANPDFEENNLLLEAHAAAIKEFIAALAV